MNKKSIGFVQVNFQQGPKEFNAFYLPYSAGVILSSALNNPQIQSQWQLRDLIWRRDNIEDTAQELAHNHIVGLSTYVWNREYNYRLGKRIKQLNPNCLMIVGGPEVAINDTDLFKKHSWMDVVIKMEGERAFGDILQHYDRSMQSIPGLLINDKSQIIDTGNNPRIENLDEIASPYLTGIFDKILQENPNVTWNATLETNRGCPYACTFCDWGSLTYNKVKKFNLSRVFHELDWIGKHCGFVTITDANLGMFVERDELIIDKLIEVQRKWGMLKNFSMSWAKNQKNEVVHMVKKLMRESPHFGSGLTVSVQSMDTNVLDNIKRKNLDQHKITEIFDLCDKHSIPVYTEIIMGLPGDTADTWKENFWKIFRCGNHTGINILHAQLLENAEMNLFQRKLYKMEAVPIFDYMSGSYDNGEVDEYLEMVVSTNTMPRDVMLDTMVWNSFIQTFHISGISTYIARYMYKAHGVDYKEFYDNLYQWLQQDTWWKKEFTDTRFFYEDWINNGRVRHPKIGGIEVPGWHLHNRSTLNLHAQGLMQTVNDTLGDFMQDNYNVPFLESLLRFQNLTIIDYNRLQEYPITMTCDYDFHGYIVDNTKLLRPGTYQFDTLEDKKMSLQMFLENFYFGRKRNFGKARISKL